MIAAVGEENGTIERGNPEQNRPRKEINDHCLRLLHSNRTMGTIRTMVFACEATRALALDAVVKAPAKHAGWGAGIIVTARQQLENFQCAVKIGTCAIIQPVGQL